MIPIFDSGHGYNTPGKRSEGFNHKSGKVLLKENSLNEAVANKLSMMFWLSGCEYHFITNEWWDVPLQERVNRERNIARDIRQRGDKSVFISIHADAFHVKNAARGGRFFYRSEGGRIIANKLTQYFRANGYGLELREPKQANFKLLRDTSSTAVLFEMGFMTTQSDLDIMLTNEFRNNTAKLLYDAIIEL